MNGFLRAARISWQASAVVASIAARVANPAPRFVITGYQLAPGEVPTTAMLNDPSRFRRTGVIRPHGCLVHLVCLLIAMPVLACCLPLLALCLLLVAAGGLQIAVMAGVRRVADSDRVWAWRRRRRGSPP